MRLVVIAGAVGLLVGCTASATPPAPSPQGPPVAVCPPDPPPGSGFVCSPSKLCTGNDQMQKLNDSLLGSLLPQKLRNFLYYQGLAVDEICQP